MLSTAGSAPYMYTALQILIPVTISLGAVFALLHWTGRRPKPLVATIHGVFAAAVLFCLFSMLFTGSLPVLGITSLALFMVAALGGVLLFTMHASQKKLPTIAIIVHAGLAVLGSAFLLMAMRAG